MSDVTRTLCELRERIEQACHRAGRNAAEVTLVGASKTVSIERLKVFLDAGLSDLGENYVQEGSQKIEALAAAGYTVHWHFIGSLQSNKARDAVCSFDLIHSVDRVPLAVAIDKAARAQNKVQEVLLQVNLSGEATKAGCRLHNLRSLAEGCAALPNLSVRGLMCLPPYHEDAEQTRPYFRQLREARDSLFKSLFTGSGAIFSPPATAAGPAVISAGSSNAKTYWHLSMGMSNDFEVAVEEGATLVRIGTRLFGERSG